MTMSNMQFLVAALILSNFLASAFCNSNDDEIEKLPGLTFKPNFKHYSGYFQVSEKHFLHYW